jgi:hypothetical protein
MLNEIQENTDKKVSKIWKKMQDMNEKFNKTDFEKKKTLRFWE